LAPAENRKILTSDATGAFTRLAPFIQEFIWTHGWTDLRDVQTRAIAAAFDTDRHRLLAAGTASGKTEAAFLPILTQLYADPPSSIGALYIGPLKALINDQFLRLTDLCQEAGILVTAWHGDVARGKKQALLRNPAGILQITPESLEGLLLRRSAELTHVFGDLRWVVIDEVHAFMESDRGGQVLALLDRLSRFARDHDRLPRRVGLSATLGDYGEAAAWLGGISNRGVEVIAEQGTRDVYLLVDRFPAPLATDDSSRRDDADTAGDRLIAREPELVRTAYQTTRHGKSLIFTNSRADAEQIVAGLRAMAEREHTLDIYHVHHGSISAELREAAETAMRDGEGPACTAATVTLELGIDLGQLDRVLQLGPTSSVASFLQRLGRAGRRGQRPEMLFLIRDDEPQSHESVLDRIPWDLLQSIAVIQLYAEEKWIEPHERAPLPGSLLYQQTMSILGSAGELTPPQLAERVLTLAPFQSFTQDDLRSLLRHLLEIDHIERAEDGALILGLAGERVVDDYRFLATFVDPTEWAVREGASAIGTVANSVPEGERFALAGRVWEVVALLEKERQIIVKRVHGGVRTLFSGAGGPDVHDRVVDRMRRILEEDTQYPYLAARALTRLAEARRMARTNRIATRPQVVALGGDRLAIIPWAGSRQLRTMTLYLTSQGKRVVPHRFWIELTTAPGEAEAVDAELGRIGGEEWDATAMLASSDRSLWERAKYDTFLPDDLLKRSFVADHLDIANAARRFSECL
jgi:ATP-dependent Lhr-like helicase